MKQRVALHKNCVFSNHVYEHVIASQSQNSEQGSQIERKDWISRATITFMQCFYEKYLFPCNQGMFVDVYTSACAVEKMWISDYGNKL